MINKLREAAHMALDALLDWEEHFPNAWSLHDKQAITALREALGENNGKRNLDGDSEHSVTDFVPVCVVTDVVEVQWIRGITNDQVPEGSVLYVKGAV